MNLMSIVLVAVAMAATFAWLEWRRVNRQHRATRIVASVIAVAALALLGAFGQRDEPEPAASPVAHAALWTQSSAAEASYHVKERDVAFKFALPGVSAAPRDAIIVPDVPYVRRHYPQVRSLQILGDGLEPHDLDALDGLDVAFAPAGIEQSKPTITIVDFPRTLTLGGSAMVQGRIIGITTGETVRLAMDGPDGRTVESAATGDAAGSAQFSMSIRSPAGEGQFVWRLRMSAAGEEGQLLAEERLGVAVVRPSLPRVLVLESSPRLETSHLRRWFGEMRGLLRSRTLVGRERYRFDSTESSNAEFAAVDAELLKGLDVLIADVQAVSALSPSERGAVRNAVAEQGLGLLLFAGSEPLKSDASPDAAFFLPWKTTPASDEPSAAESDARAARLEWAGLGAPLEHPVQVERSVIEPADGETRLVSDTQSRALVTSISRGRGQIALSLVRDTWRWRVEERPALFARYWSFLLGHLAKAQTGEPARWTIANPSKMPLLVDQPLSLRYSASGSPTSAAEITSDVKGERIALPLGQDAVEPHNWHTTFWPRRPGWHRVTMPPQGAQLDFFVHDRDEWASVRPARRRAITGAFAARSKAPVAAERASSSSPLRRMNTASAAGLFVVFFLSCGYLWIERQRLSGEVRLSQAA